MIDLGSLDGIGNFGYAYGINDGGLIVGQSGSERAVLWRPREDLAIDFGPTYGAWILAGATWTPLHGLSPLAMVTGDLVGNGSDDLLLTSAPGLVCTRG